MYCVDKFLKYFNESIDRRKSSKGIIISDTNKILVLRIQTGCHAEGVWDLPGGGIEDNETALDCLKREIKEETNLELTDIKPLKQEVNFDIPEDGVHAKWKYFKAKCTNTNVVLNPAKWLGGKPEHSEYKWLDSLEELDKLDMCDEHKKIVRKELVKLVSKSPNKF